MQFIDNGRRLRLRRLEEEVCTLISWDDDVAFIIDSLVNVNK